MEFKPLDRTDVEYHAVLADWLAVNDLSVREAALVRALIDALNKSRDDFDQVRRICVQPAFFPTLKSAAQKALTAGVLTSWRQYAAET